MPKTYTTYLKLNLHSEGATPTEVTNKMKSIGWTPIFGPYDYKRTWDTDIGVETNDVDKFMPYIDEVHKVLKGLNVSYTVRTYETGTEEFKSPE